MSLPKLIRFSDLKERGIVNNRVTLGQWIRRKVSRLAGCSETIPAFGMRPRSRRGSRACRIEGTIKRPIPSHKRGAHAAQ